MTFHPRSLLDKELNRVRTDILRLASLVDTAIEQSLNALYKRNVLLAHQVVVADEEINHLRYTIEDECMRILATQQPAAIDLRTVIAAIHLAVELERIGDHASGIARLVERMEDEDSIESLHKLPKMADRARAMVQESITAFMQSDVALAEEMIRRDDKLDRQYRKFSRQLLGEMRDKDYLRRANFLLWVGHNLERIGDRATNIAERVIFMVKNEFVEIQHDLDADY